MNIKAFFFIIIISLTNYDLHSQTISPYAPTPIPKPYTPSSKRNLNLEYKLICQKQLNYDISQADKYARFCLNANSPCPIKLIDLKHSSWLQEAANYSYNRVGYTIISLKNGNFYYFNYIPNSILSLWEQSISPGQFYHKYIKFQYRMTKCMSYEP